MEAINRRLFLMRSSMAVAAAGVATAIAPALTAAETEAPAADAAVDSGAAETMSEPLVAHVRDLASGEIGIYSGTREVTFHDPGLASRLFNATR
jgi:hypothetical protein